MPDTPSDPTGSGEISPIAASPPPEGYCLRCQSRLPYGGDKCRDCGLQFDWGNGATYSSRPRFLAPRFWFPAFCLAVVSGVISYAIVMKTGEMGFALFVSVPVSFGAIIGFGTRSGRFLAVLLGLVAVLSVVLAIVTVNLAGFFCGATLGIIFILPALLGVLLGFLLRVFLSHTRWDQRRYLPLLFFALLPYGCELVENSIPGEHAVATVETGLTIDATPEEAWQALMFYEDVKHQPPWLLKLALPKPLRSEGRKSQVGDVVRCVYDRGRICKQVTAVAAPRKLAFNIVEQRVHFEHDVKLRSGSFEFVPIGKRKTRVVLTTRYERLCWPEWFWGPIERKVIHTLHEHVIEGIQQEAQDKRGGDSPETKPPVPEHDPLVMRGDA